MPGLVLPAVGGGLVRSWDYKTRSALVVWLAGSGVSEAAFDVVATSEPDVRREGAELVVILRESGDQPIYWRELVRDNRPDIDQALSWLAYINILEPECGTCVPAWPVD